MANNHHHRNLNTHTIVSEFIRLQLLDKGYEWQPQAANTIAVTSQYQNVCRGLQRWAINLSDFIHQHLPDSEFTEIISLLDGLQPEQAHSTFVSLSDELFSVGVGWAKIITFLVTGTELAYNCVEKNNEQMVDDVSEWLSSYIDDHLLAWIRNNGGWEALVELTPSNGTLKNVVYGVAAGVAALTIYLCIKSHS